jgi:hypothetical protein
VDTAFAQLEQAGNTAPVREAFSLSQGAYGKSNPGNS